MQSIIEARAGGETGVDRVQFLSGEALWKAADEGLWSPRLADAAMAAELGPNQPPLRQLTRTPAFNQAEPFGTLIHYRDGLKGLVLKVGDHLVDASIRTRLQQLRRQLASAT